MNVFSRIEARGEDGPALRTTYFIQMSPPDRMKKLQAQPYKIFCRSRFQAMSFTACHEGLDEMSFHHLQWTRQKSRIVKIQTYSLPLEIRTLIQITQSELLKYNATKG